ncbi:adenylate cyclase activating polypeptide 1b [Salmo trutta]|uniref:adenylate cyclase activating polypeptide 1b n=1 Tax=Salmo trutta TaxID=8032 RepID=UPI001130E560|nr:glucagon family neuropeptides-like [Salmo trutta]
MAQCHRPTLVLLVYGILMHCSVYCLSIGLTYPKIRLENEVYEEEGNMLTDISFDNDQISIRSPPSLDDIYTLKFPTEKRTERRAEEVVARTLREILGQLTARQYLTALMMIPVGEERSMEDESEPLSKRHSDGIFTDGYSRYRKQMAMKKYLEAVLGRRYRQRFKNKVWRLTYL